MSFVYWILLHLLSANLGKNHCHWLIKWLSNNFPRQPLRRHVKAVKNYATGHKIDNTAQVWDILNPIGLKKMHGWFKSYNSFTGPGKKVFFPKQNKNLSWRNNLQCIVVDLHREGSATNGATLFNFRTNTNVSRWKAKTKTNNLHHRKALSVAVFLA